MLLVDISQILNCRAIRCSIVVSISACHAEDPGSIPGGGVLLLLLFSFFSSHVRSLHLCSSHLCSSHLCSSHLCSIEKDALSFMLQVAMYFEHVHRKAAQDCSNQCVCL